MRTPAVRRVLFPKRFGLLLALGGVCFWSLLLVLSESRARIDVALPPKHRPVPVSVIRAKFASFVDDFRSEETSQVGRDVLVFSLSTVLSTKGQQPLYPSEEREEEDDVTPENWPGLRLANILSEVESGRDVLECGLDAELLENASHDNETLFFAVNLYNNEAVMPNFVLQLLRLVSLFPTHKVGVSIYESGSNDGTPEWLELLKDLLDFADTRNKIVAQGSLVRAKKEGRIEFLARVRNAALEPLWEWVPTWKSTKVVFLNDVFFCPQHALRLLANEADIACGIDVVRALAGLKKEEQRLVMVKDLTLNFGLPKSMANAISRWYWLLRQWRWLFGKRPETTRHLPLIFYDKWVAHDAMGLQFSNNAPYVQDAYGASRMARGLPFPVHACWNGLVVLDATPFYMGLRARHNLPGECAGSECLLMCHDFIRLGFRHIVVDPGVRVAYTYMDALHTYSNEYVRGIDFVPWSQTVNEPMQKDSKQPPVVECCELLPGKEIVDFEHNCYQFNVQENFTRLALDSRKNEEFI